MEKEELVQLVSQGMSTYQIAQYTQKSQTSVRYWLKKYELKTRPSMPKTRSAIWRYSDDVFREIIDRNQSVSDCLWEIGVTRRKENYTSFYARCKELHIIPPKAKNGAHRKTNEEMFALNSKTRRETLRRRILSLGLKQYKCAICGLPPLWNGKKLVLTLDHINGNPRDNRLSNLRFVCPNCDRQLPTYCSHNCKQQRGLG